MEIPCTCGYNRSVCVDCMQDHIDSLHDNLRKLAERLTKEAANSESNRSKYFQGYRSGIREAVIAINEYIRKNK